MNFFLFSRPKNEGPPRKRRAKTGDSDDEVEKMEENYEEEKEAEAANVQPIRELLPIKTKDGLVRRTTTEMVEKLKPRRDDEGNYFTEVKLLCTIHTKCETTLIKSCSYVKANAGFHIQWIHTLI